MWNHLPTGITYSEKQQVSQEIKELKPAKKNEQQQKQRKSNENVSELCAAKRPDRLKKYLYSYIYLLYIQACMCN